MIKIENTEVHGVARAIYSARNAMNSWDKSDSRFETDTMGENDLKLAKQLVKAGTDHSKFMRMITVTCDITAPQYFVAEMDTYKVGTVRNSCSLQHTGASKPFTIRDFTVEPEIYEALDPQKAKREHNLVYSDCLESDYKIYMAGDRKYKVYKNGKIIACEFERIHEKDNRARHFKEREVIPSKTINGYYELNLGGRVYLERWLIHCLVAEVWLQDSYFDGAEINHKDGNKGNNSVENLEWCTHSYNEKHKHDNGLDGRTLHTNYIAWKTATKTKNIQGQILSDRKSGLTYRELVQKYKVSMSTIVSICNYKGCENATLFVIAEMWENIISGLNKMRELYLLTGDYNYFRAIRELLPMGYNYRFTWQANYAVLRNIYHARKNHKLSEWRDFCKWIEELPYSELITEE